MDAITLLREDHRAVKGLFQQFEKTSERAKTTRAGLVEKMTAELSRHAAIEEQLFYPAVRQAVPDVEDEVLEGLEEHHVAKWILSELEHLTPTDERFQAKVTVLIESVRHHMHDEETELFPVVRKALGRKRLAELGELMAKARTTAPTRPHPRSPDTPPANVLTGAIASTIDRAFARNR